MFIHRRYITGNLENSMEFIISYRTNDGIVKAHTIKVNTKFNTKIYLLAATN